MKTPALANKPVHFVLLSDSFIVFLQNVWNLDL